MSRLKDKTIISRNIGNDPEIPASFHKEDFTGGFTGKGYDVIHEKAYMCPCISFPSGSAMAVCKNCGGTGLFFANPTKTKMIITSIAMDSKLKEAALREWGNVELGSVKLTALNDDKLTYMDRITILDATAEHNEILRPKMDDDDVQFFTYTKYDIKDIDFIGLFENEGVRIKRLLETVDYTYVDNIIKLVPSYNTLSDPTITIRYVHNPSFHVTEILRESMTSAKENGQIKMIMPIHALAKRAHLVKDVENFDGDRLLDNSWLPSMCEAPDMTVFQKQLRYSTAQFIFDNLTTTQKSQLLVLLS
jgi:hypothetical protein